MQKNCHVHSILSIFRLTKILCKKIGYKFIFLNQHCIIGFLGKMAEIIFHRDIWHLISWSFSNSFWVARRYSDHSFDQFFSASDSICYKMVLRNDVILFSRIAYFTRLTLSAFSNLSQNMIFQLRFNSYFRR